MSSTSDDIGINTPKWRTRKDQNTFKKILNLIPDHWEDVLAEAKTYERHFDKAQRWAHTHHNYAKDGIKQIGSLLEIDGKQVTASIEDTAFYKELDKIPLDIPNWIYVPEGFDWTSESDRKAFLEEKFALLKVALKKLSITRWDGQEINTNLACDQLYEVVSKLANALAGIDVEDSLAVEAFKIETMDQVRPKVYLLVETCTGLDMHAGGSASGSNSPSPDDRLSTLVNIPEKIMDAIPEAPASELPAEITAALNTMHSIQHALPVVKTELERATPELGPLLDQFGEIETWAAHLKTHFPLIAESVQALLTGHDLTDLDSHKLTAEVKELFSLIYAFLNTSPLTQQLLILFQEVSNLLPVRLVGFEAGLTTEQQMAQWLEEAKAIFTLPNDQEAIAPDQIMAWLQEKLEAMAAWINHISILGKTIDPLYEKAQSPIEQLLATEGADLSSVAGIATFVLDKLVLITKWISLGEVTSSKNETVTKDKSTSGDGAGSDTATGERALKGMTGLLSEGLEKGQLIWHFIQENDLGLRLEDKPSEFQPATLQPTSYQVKSGATSAAVEIAFEHQQAEQAGGANASGQMGATTAENTAQNQEEQAEPLNWGQVLLHLLGDRNSGPISQLEGEQQDLAMDLKNNELAQRLEEDMKRLWEESGLQVVFDQAYQALKDQLDLEKENPETPSAADLLALLLEGVFQLYEAVLPWLEQLLNYALELLVRFIDLIFELIKAFRIPEELRTLLPQKIKEVLLGEDDPNLIALLLALPTVVLHGFLNLEVQDLKDWMDAA